MEKAEVFQFILLIAPVLAILLVLSKNTERRIRQKRGTKQDLVLFDRIYHNLRDEITSIEYIDFVDQATTVIGLKTSKLSISYTRTKYIDGIHESARFSGKLCTSELILARYGSEAYEMAGGVFIKDLITNTESPLGASILEMVCKS
ncbi:MAG: hypothetical protein M3Q64_02940, partial [bacterium]|nr:hypothetical protein [bacterium]